LASINNEYIDQAVEGLICTFGAKEPVLSAPIFEALNAGKIQDAVTIIAENLGLPVIIDLSTVKLATDSQSREFGEKFKSTCIVSSADPGQTAQSITAQVLIPSDLPIYGTSKLKNLHLHVKVSDNCQKYPKTFAAVMAHELSHIVLHSIRHSQRDNEFFTDLTAMILGFSEILGEGRKTVETKESSSKLTRVNKTTTVTTTTTYGYLSDELFNFAFKKITNTFIEFKKNDKELQEKILTRVASYKNLVTDYAKRCELLSKLLKNFDKNPKNIRKEDASGIVRMHQLYFLEGIADVGKRNLNLLNGISEASTKTLTITKIFSKQRLNQLLDLLQKVENLTTEMEKETNSVEKDISLLAKYANFFERHQIINQLQQLKKRATEITPK
jgi:hypothetical protein